jgi:hypothetical protein
LLIGRKQNSARIKLHRYCAFYDIPVFSETHCDLKNSAPRPFSSSFATTPDHMDISMETSPTSGSCGCGSSLPTQLPSLGTSITTSISPETRPSTTSSDSATTEYLHPFPFSNHISSKLCLKSALAIASAFEALPLPAGSSLGHLAPRTMPSFACCAMQSAYTLLMVYHRTWVQLQQQQENPLLQNQQFTPLQQSHVQHPLQQSHVQQSQESQFLSPQSLSPAYSPSPEQTGRQTQQQIPHHQLLTQCDQGLKSVLQALDNYSIAFEALGGMKDQVRLAIDCLDLY